MPQPRKYKTNAERQAAYRRRKALAEATGSPGTRPGRQNQALVARVMAADAARS